VTYSADSPEAPRCAIRPTTVCDGKIVSMQPLDVMTMAAADRSQPHRLQLTNGRIVYRGPVLSSRQCWVATGDMAAEQPLLRRGSPVLRDS
jgi:hypothetical protein